VINFIICDDNEIMNKNIEKIITKIMMPLNDDYKIHNFSDYNNSLKSLIRKKIGNKIYILDVEIPSKSGLDIAREIRMDDWNSIIIFLTAHYELKQAAFKNRLMLLDFISKYDDCEKELTENIKLALKILGTKQVLTFMSNYITYRINLSDIIYIIRDSVDRKTIIRTPYTKYMVNKNICDIKKQLDDHFYQTHRSAIVNKDYIDKIDYKKDIITFKNKETINLLSKGKKKGLKLCVGSNN